MKNSLYLIITLVLVLFVASCTSVKEQKTPKFGLGHSAKTAEDSAYEFVEDDGTMSAIVIMLHGFQGQLNEVADIFKQLATALKMKGISSYRFNFDGEGARNNYYITSTLASRVQESLNVYRQLRNDYPRVKIGILGFSLGGLTAVEVITTDAVAVDSTVLWSSVYDGGYTLISDDYETNLKLRNVVEKGYYTEKNWAEHTITKEHVLGFLGYNSFAVIKNYKGAMLTIRGDKDFLPQRDEELLKHLSTKNKKHVSLAGADHIFNVFDDEKTQQQAVITLTTDFFVSTLLEK